MLILTWIQHQHSLSWILWHFRCKCFSSSTWIWIKIRYKQTHTLWRTIIRGHQSRSHSLISCDSINSTFKVVHAGKTRLFLEIAIELNYEQTQTTKQRKGQKEAASLWEGQTGLQVGCSLLRGFRWDRQQSSPLILLSFLSRFPFDFLYWSMCSVMTACSISDIPPPPRNMGGWVSCTEIWARGRVCSSLHHFTVSDQHKKWVSGVGEGRREVFGGGRGRSFVREMLVLHKSLASLRDAASCRSNHDEVSPQRFIRSLEKAKSSTQSVVTCYQIYQNSQISEFSVFDPPYKATSQQSQRGAKGPHQSRWEQQKNTKTEDKRTENILPAASYSWMICGRKSTTKDQLSNGIV